MTESVLRVIWDMNFDGSRSPSIGFYDRRLRDMQSISQHEFLGCVLDAAQRFRSSGIRIGQYVALLTSSSRASLIGYFASQLLGAIPAVIPVRPAFDSVDVQAQRVSSALKLFDADTHVVAEGIGRNEVLNGILQARLEFDFDGLTSLKETPEELGFTFDGSSASHVQLSSGSTSTSHGVLVGQDGLLANLKALSSVTGARSGQAFVGWLPLYHDMGLVSQALLPMFANCAVYMLSPFDFLADPVAWVRMLSKYGGSICASPTSGYRMVLERVTDKDVESLNLSRWELAACGAEPVSASVLEEFAARFAPCGFQRNALRPTYGLAEATLAVSMSQRGSHNQYIRVHRTELGLMNSITPLTQGGACAPDEIDVVGLGPAIDGTTIRIVDDEGNTVPGDSICGEVLVSGESNAIGLLQDGGEVVPFPNGEIHTGDIGFMHDGELFVVERIKNIIIRHGENYAATVLEDTVAEVLGLSADNIVVVDADVQVGDNLVAIIEVTKTSDTDALREAIHQSRDRFTPPLDTVCFVKRGSIPRTTSGKKRHLTARERFNSNELKVIQTYALRGDAAYELIGGADQGETRELRKTDVVNTEPESPVAREVLAVVSKKVRLRGLDVPVTLDASFQYDLEFDSLGILELAMTCERQFGVHITRDALSKVIRVRDLVDVIARGAQQETSGERGITEQVMDVRTKAPQHYTVVDAVRPNRKVLIDDRWVDDFASGCYMGMDEDTRVIAASEAMVESWGLQRGWTRAVATPAPLLKLERRIADNIGVDDVMVFGTVTLLHLGVLPLLGGETGAILIDSEAHKSMHEAATLARAKGTTVLTFQHDDESDLRSKLVRTKNHSIRIIVVDGVYSMLGTTVDLERYQEIAREYDAYIYVDDAHGYGMLGANPTDELPYGYGGGGVVQHLGCSYDRIIYVGGLTKSYSAMLAFISCPTPEFRQLFEMASTMVFVHAPPTSTIAQAHAVLDVNETEGDKIRARIYGMTCRLIDGAHDLGFVVKTTGFPIVKVQLGSLAETIEGCQIAWKHGILLTPAVFPAAPIDAGGLRLTVTAANTDDQIDVALAALREISETRDGRVGDSADRAVQVIDLTCDEVATRCSSSVESPVVAAR